MHTLTHKYLYHAAYLCLRLYVCVNICIDDAFIFFVLLLIILVVVTAPKLSLIHINLLHACGER